MKCPYCDNDISCDPLSEVLAKIKTIAQHASACGDFIEPKRALPAIIALCDTPIAPDHEAHVKISERDAALKAANGTIRTKLYDTALAKILTVLNDIEQCAVFGVADRGVAPIAISRFRHIRKMCDSVLNDCALLDAALQRAEVAEANLAR